jgi:hypothetical protein
VTFNVYNFTTKRLEVIESCDMDEDLLCAAVSLPMWFPPVIRQGQTLLDAVYATDGNVGEGVRRGADEMWAIWTVADQPDYRDGFLAQYFHIIEIVADTHFFRDWEEIAAVNAAIDRHGGDASRPTPDLQLREGYRAGVDDVRPPPGRKRIAQHLIRQEVPIHYLLNLSRDRMNETIEMGVRDAREYCRSVGLLKTTVPVPGPATPVLRPPVALDFTEEMKGFVTPGEEDPEAGEREGKVKGNRLDFRLTIRADDLDRFIDFPEHEARAVGWVDCPILGGRMDVRSGRFNLFTVADHPGPDPANDKRMLYNLTFATPDGTTYRLDGTKFVHDDPGFDAWADLTTLFTRVFRVESGRETLWGAGVLHIHLLDFARQLTTFRVHEAAGPAESLAALVRFGRFFMGRAWDVYARNVIDFAPF